MKLKSVGLLGVDSSRTRAYLDALSRNGLKLEHAFLLAPDPKRAGAAFPEVPFFDNLTPSDESLSKQNVPHSILPTSSVNDPTTVEAVAQSGLDVLIYSGPGGVIVGRELLRRGGKLLHVHPGIVPQYRGSTTVYYSLLNEGTCGASAIFLDERIDCGPILATREFPAPTDRSSIDYGYDPYIRSQLLIDVLKKYVESGHFHTQNQDNNDSSCDTADSSQNAETYYVMHPVLRHITILSRAGVSSQPARRHAS